MSAFWDRYSSGHSLKLLYKISLPKLWRQTNGIIPNYKDFVVGERKGTCVVKMLTQHFYITKYSETQTIDSRHQC